MSKEPVPLNTVDISAFARNLTRQLTNARTPPSHVEMLNHLARAGGFRNYQHLRAAHTAKVRLAAPPDAPADYKLIEKTLHQFDAQGRLIQWPGKRQVQELALWTIWAALPAETVMEERDVNGVLNRAHLFEDAAILRRSLIGMGLLERNLDGSDYRRTEQRPPPEAQALIREVSQRRKA